MDPRHHIVGPTDLRFVPPDLPLDHLIEFTRRDFGIEGEFKALEGERDQNHRITTADGRRFVLKVAGALEDPGITDFQVRALLHLEHRAPDLPVPRLVCNHTGEPIGHTESASGETHWVRLLTYVPGIPFRDGRRPSLEALRALGTFQGRLADALSDFSHPHSQHFMPWDQSNGLVLNPSLWRRYADGIEDLEQSHLPHMENSVFPALAKLRHQVIHNDAHSENVLRADEESERITGLIDFGDLVDAPLADDLAVSIASFIEDQPDFIATASAITSGFHSVMPLADQEIDLLYDLVLVRCVLNVLLLGLQNDGVAGDVGLEPDREISRQGIRELIDIGRAPFTDGLHEACRATHERTTST